MNFLDKVLPVKHAEVEQLQTHLKENKFARLCDDDSKIIFIAEVKPKSPSAGKLIAGEPLELVLAYEKGGADAISVLTDETFFGGSNALFTKIRKKTKLPLLRKEFIVDESQLVESLLLGADAVLLIVQLLSPKKLAELIHFSNQLGLVPLVEVLNETELNVAIQSGAEYIGVNSRNLQTMEVNPQQALAVLRKVPSPTKKFLFSGIENPQQVKEAVEAGANGLLIGTSLIKSSDPEELLKELRAAI